MTPEKILAHAPRVLTEDQRTTYFKTGFLAAEGLIPSAWLQGDESELTRLLELAMHRRKRVADLLARCGHPRATTFPNWKSA